MKRARLEACLSQGGRARCTSLEHLGKGELRSCDSMEVVSHPLQGNKVFWPVEALEVLGCRSPATWTRGTGRLSAIVCDQSRLLHLLSVPLGMGHQELHSPQCPGFYVPEQNLAVMKQ